MKTQRVNPRREISDFFDHLDHWWTFILANLLWCILSIPILTIPAATAGLFSVMSLWTRDKQPEVFQEFFGAIRRLWLKSSVIMLLNVMVGGLLAFNLSIFPMMSTNDPIAFLSRSVTWFAVLVLLMVNMYVWSLLVVKELPLKPLLATSARLVFVYPVWSLGVLAVAAIPVIVSLFLPQAAFLLFTFSSVAAIITKGTRRIIRRHFPEENLEG